jgi:N-acetylmuramoyl-L-alanine amidase CwlA
MNIDKKLISKNYSKGVTITPKYIVIHETGNTAVGANAEAHFKYWNTNDKAQASAHFVVDDTKVIQLLELNQRAWHVGDNKGYSDITNSNSIGVEICVNSDGDYDKAVSNAVELVQWLLKETGLNIDSLKTHNNASDKNCPTIMLRNNMWDDFKNRVSAPTPIPDVPWYNDAQWWVKENGISDGTRPNEPVTRAELWQMLYRFAKL